MANNKPRIVKRPTSEDEDIERATAQEEAEELQEEVAERVEDLHVLEESDETPEVYELSCGYTDKDGVLHKTFTVRDMTGFDEEAIQNGNNKKNPSKAINLLLFRCTQSIGTLERKDFKPAEWQDIINSLYIGDQDLIIMKIRERSISDEIESEHLCPNCGAKLTTVMAIDELVYNPFEGDPSDATIPFELPRGYRDRSGKLHKKGVMHLPTGNDREVLTPLAKKNLSKANTALLTRTCRFSDGLRVTDDVMASLVVKDREYLNKLLNDNNFGYDFQVDVECDQCGAEFKGQLNAVNFLK